MASYRYRAFDPSGRPVQGVVEAETPAAAAGKLRDKRLRAAEIAPGALGAWGRLRGCLAWAGSSRRREQAATATRQLAVLVRSGMPVLDALEVLASQSAGSPLGAVLEGVKGRVREGSGLGDAMAEHPAYFDALYVSMVHAGEASGSLDAVLARMSSHMRERARLEARIRNALAYPAVMVVVVAAVVAFLVTVVVPKIAGLLLQRKQALPLPTEVLMAVSGFLRSYGVFVLAGGVAGAVLLGVWFGTERGAYLRDRALLALPLVGGLFLRRSVSRFASTLALLLRSGLPMHESLGIVRGVVGNRLLEAAAERIQGAVVGGADLSAALGAEPVFPPIVRQMAGVGEESGELPELLDAAAEGFDEEVALSAERLVALIEPALIVAMAVVVGFIILSVVLPLLRFSAAVR